MNMPRVNGRIVANTYSSSYLSKNKLGKLTDMNMVENILRMRPAQYDKAMLRLFTDTKLFSNDFLDLITSGAKPFMVDDPEGTFTYKIKKRAELPKIMVNLADTTAQPGVDGSTFELVFDKNAFVVNDIITAHRYEQDVQIQIASDFEPYQEFFKYTCRAIGKYATDFVSQKYLVEGTEYFKVGSLAGEWTTQYSSLGLFDGHLEVMANVLQKYGVEHSITEWADARKMGAETDVNGNPLDLTFYSVADVDPENGKTKFQFKMWEPTITRLMRMEMMRMKANTFVWGREGSAVDEKGRPMRAKPGLWQQLHLGNVIYYEKGSFSLNLIRSAVGDLFYNRVRIGERRVKIYTNRAGMELASTAMRKDYNGQGFITNGKDFLDGKDRLKQGYAFQFDHFMTVETGPVEFVELEQLNTYSTFLELGPNKKTPPIFIIMDISNDGGSNVREVKLSTRPSMNYHVIQGMANFGPSQTVVSSKNPWNTYVMEDYCGVFLEDPTRTVILKEYPRL